MDVNLTRVVLWAKTDKWYVQPLIDAPFTKIQSNGDWENWTHPWTRIAALLVDTTYQPGAIRLEHPATDPGVLAWDEKPEKSADRIIEFSGYQWRVKTADIKLDPGPNYFSDSSESVWVDSAGLHLAIRQRDGKWFCAEVVLLTSLGYGEYTFQLVSRVDSLVEPVVFAGFVYESVDREIDIEFSRGLAAPDNSQYVVQPFQTPGNLCRFTMPATATSTHRFTWHADSIFFASWEGFADAPTQNTLINSWPYQGADIPPPGNERMRFNLWLLQGQPPQQEAAVVVRSFHFTP